MKKLTFLGHDAGYGRYNTSAYTIINNNLLLIDCGTTVFKQLYLMDKANSFLKRKNNIEVIITHLHDDHVGSLGLFINYCYYNLHKKVKLYSKCKYLKTRLDIANCPINGYEILDNYNIKFIKTNHCNGMDTYGFNININGTNIVYTGDTNNLEPFYKYLTINTELYVDVSYDKNPVHLNLVNVFDDLYRLSLNGINVYIMHLDKQKEIREYINNTNIHLCSDDKLNKNDIISTLKEYQFDPNNYRVISGSAMVLYGFKPFTKDIDITVTKSYYQYLLNNYDCKFEKINQFNDPIFFINDIINFGQTYFNKRKNIINDIPVQTKKDLIELKRQLNRPKDIKELKLIK